MTARCVVGGLAALAGLAAAAPGAPAARLRCTPSSYLMQEQTAEERRTRKPARVVSRKDCAGADAQALGCDPIELPLAEFTEADDAYRYALSQTRGSLELTSQMRVSKPGLAFEQRVTTENLALTSIEVIDGRCVLAAAPPAR